MNRSYDLITFTSKYLYFKKARVSFFADIIKIVAMFIKKTLKLVSVIFKRQIYFLVISNEVHWKEI